jgi:hypothetical protein
MKGREKFWIMRLCFMKAASTWSNMVKQIFMENVLKIGSMEEYSGFSVLLRESSRTKKEFKMGFDYVH